MTKTNVQPIPSNSQHHDTPNNKTHVIKFRVTAEEKVSLELTCNLLNLSLSTFIRRAIHNVKIEKTVIVAGCGEETLTAVSTLLAQCSKVGGNLNQLARHFNSGGADTEQIRAKLLDELADRENNYRCQRRRRNPDRCFHFACPVQQSGQQSQPACKALQFRRRRHRTAAGETP